MARWILEKSNQGYWHIRPESFDGMLNISPEDCVKLALQAVPLPQEAAIEEFQTNKKIQTGDILSDGIKDLCIKV